jgi:hypothetical protein
MSPTGPTATCAGQHWTGSSPEAVRTDAPWHDLLAAPGRTDETRGTPWRWDSRVR